MAVAAVLVVGDDDLRADLADDGDRVGHGLVEVGVPEGAGVLVGRRPIIPESR